MTERAIVDARADPGADCFHCGLPLPDPARHAVEWRGTARAVCCAGCQAVAETIIAGGHDVYYANRTQAAARPADVVPDLLADLALYDRPDVQASFVEAISVAGGMDDVAHRRDDAAPGSSGAARRGPDVREAALLLEGIVCPACVWLNEQHVRRLPGVLDARIDYSTRRARVRWDAARIRLSEILQAIAAIGYRATPYQAAAADGVRRRERRAALWRLFVAGFGMMQVMMVAIPAYIAGEGEMSADIEGLLRWAALVLTVPVVAIASTPFFQGALRDLRLRRLGMDVPVALAIVIAFAASVVNTVRGAGEVWFDSVSMFVFFLLAGRYLEMLARNRAARAIEDLARLRPALADRMSAWPRSRATETVAAGTLAAADHVLVRAGAQAPADGIVVDGHTSFDEAALTGESRPIGKSAGDRVLGGTVNRASAIVMRIERVGADTWMHSIERLMQAAASARPRLARLADRAASAFVAVILALAALTAWGWWLIDPSQAVIAAVTVLVVTCPCALSLATPVALAAATTRLARGGILLADPDAIERLARIDTVLFDKTGTLTEGRLTLASITPVGSLAEDECLALAASLEQSASHPIARAIVEAAGARGLVPASPASLLETPGAGVEGTIAGRRYRLGAEAFAGVPAPRRKAADTVASRTRAWLVGERGLLAVFELDDVPRPDAATTLARLRARRLELEVLSGDHPGVTGATARALGLSRWHGALAPEGKRARIEALQREGRVLAMVGDGVNDGPVLAQADVSIALASAQPLARMHADIVLLRDRLGGVAEAIAIARRTRGVIRQNLAWALVYNIASVPLAAVGLVPPWLAGLGMAASSLVVVANSVRLAPRASQADPVAVEPAGASWANPPVATRARAA